MTASMPWVKIWTEILDDHKLGRLDAATKWQFVALCLLAGECDAEGYLANGDEPLTVDDIAWRLRESPDDIEEALAALQDAGLVTEDEGCWLVVNFSKRQGRAQSEKRRQWRERKRRQRDTAGRDETGTDETVPEDVTRDITVTPGCVPENVTRDITVTPAGVTAPEKRRGEKRREDVEEEAERDTTTTTAPSAAFDTFLRMTGGAINPLTVDQLQDLVDECEVHRQALPRASPGRNVSGDGWVENAILEAAASTTNGRVSVKYLSAILDRWKREGYQAPRTSVNGDGELYRPLEAEECLPVKPE